MKKLTKKEKLSQQAEAKTYLEEIFQTNKKAFTRCEWAGESRRVFVYVVTAREDGPEIRNITYLVARLLGDRRSKNGGIIVNGHGFCAEGDVIEGINYKLYGVKPLADAETKKLYIKMYSF